MSRRAVVAGLSAIAMAASGCGGDSNPEAKFRAWFNHVKFRVAFKQSFGEAPWYHHITGMKAADGGLLGITTDLGPKSDSETVALTICGAASKIAADLGELGDGIKAVQMTGSDGVELGGCA